MVHTNVGDICADNRVGNICLGNTALLLVSPYGFVSERAEILQAP